MHESIMSTGKPEDYWHYQTVCDALNSRRPEPGYGWQMVTLASHPVGHTWKMVYRSDKRPTLPAVQGLMSEMTGASLAIKHTRTLDHCVVKTEIMPTGLDPKAYGPLTRDAACEFADRMNATKDEYFYEVLALGSRLPGSEAPKLDKDALKLLIEAADYEGVRDQDGWETLELTVRSDYPRLADLILEELK